MNRRMFWVTLAATMLAATAAWSSPILDDYFVAGTNFPVNFIPSAPLTFNATGDLTIELVPTSEVGVNRLTVFEQVMGFSPSGAEILRFHFDFLTSPNLGEPFSFTISGLDWDMPGRGELDQAFIAVQFGTGGTGAQDGTLATTWANLPNGLSVTFTSPRSWNEIFGQNTPTDLTVDFLPTIKHIPEPSGLLLMSALSVGVLWRRRSSR